MESTASSPTRQTRTSAYLLALVLVALVGSTCRPASSQPPRIPVAEEHLMHAGLAALTAGQPTVAVVIFQNLLAINPNHYGATFQLAAAFDRSGQVAEARLYWEKMRAMAETVNDAPTLVLVRARLAQPMTSEEKQSAAMKAGLDALYQRKDGQAAAVEFQKVLALNPTHYGATFQLATALDRTGQPAEARRFWEMTLKMAESYNDAATIALARDRLASNP